MRVELTYDSDGKGMGFKVLDDPEDANISPTEMRRRLDASEVGAQLRPSLLAVRGILVNLLASQANLQDDVQHSLLLLDQLTKYALVVDMVEQDKEIVHSEYRRQILAMQRILAGDVLRGKDGLRVTDGVFQAAVIQLIEERQPTFASAEPERRGSITEDVCGEIHRLAGSAPSAAIVGEALAVAGRKGRPRGTHNGGSPGRGKDDVFNDLLREIGLASSSSEGLKKQRKKRGDT